jgi:metacaspase-1
MATTRKKSAGTPQALSLHIGLNAVSPAHYGGWSGDLAACEFDANDMAAIAKAQGMKPTVLLTKKGTRDNVLSAMRGAAKALGSGDLFLLTFSGHGGQVPDVTGDEDDKQDETWCLFDAQLIDDELYFELSRFAAGVRIVVLSDSCHSGTVTRDLPSTVAIVPTAQPSQRPKLMPRSVGLRTYRDNQAFYDKLQREIAKAAGGGAIDPDAALANVAISSRLTAVVKEFRPAAILISGCQDNQTSMDGANNGAFTEQLLAVWNNGGFKGSYASFHARIRARLPPTQSPNLFGLGAAGELMAQQPFSV